MLSRRGILSGARHHDDVADIRGELWLLLAILKEVEIDSETADSMVEVLDSLIDLIRLEGELKHSGGEAGCAGKEEAKCTTTKVA